MTETELDAIEAWAKTDCPEGARCPVCWERASGNIAFLVAEVRQLKSHLWRRTTCDCGRPLGTALCGVCDNDT